VPTARIASCVSTNKLLYCLIHFRFIKGMI
jgi:hypothetical protein